MNETTKNSLLSVITSTLLSGAALTIGAKLGLSHEAMVAFANAAAPVVLAVIVFAGTFVYKALPKPKASIIKGATEQPGVHAVLTDKSTADTGPLAGNPKVVSAVSPMSPVVQANGAHVTS